MVWLEDLAYFIVSVWAYFIHVYMHLETFKMRTFYKVKKKKALTHMIFKMWLQSSQHPHHV